jgi:carbon-monoxide dehydrogenase catalytic subunit
LVSCCEIVKEGGLGDELAELPVVGACLSSIHEKAIAIGQYFVASGTPVVFGEDMLPIEGSENVKKYLMEEIENDLGGKWMIESDPVKAADLICEAIEKKRDALGINQDTERKLFGMDDRRELDF